MPCLLMTSCAGGVCGSIHNASCYIFELEHEIGDLSDKTHGLNQHVRKLLEYLVTGRTTSFTELKSTSSPSATTHQVRMLYRSQSYEYTHLPRAR